MASPTSASSAESSATLGSSGTMDNHVDSPLANPASVPAQSDEAVAAIACRAMEEFISQRINRWTAKQRPVPDKDYATQLATMCWDNDHLPPQGAGCLMRREDGEYTYIPYDDSREGLSPDILERMSRLDAWAVDSANAMIMCQVDRLMTEKIREECFWEFLDDNSDVSRVDFHGKVRILAKYRLQKRGFDVSPRNPHHTMFSFGMTDVDEFGGIRMGWAHLDWACTEADITRRLESYSRPSYSPEDVLPRQLKELEGIHHPEELATAARALTEKLKSRQPAAGSGPKWVYFLCDMVDKDFRFKDVTWLHLNQVNGIKMMKRLSREQGKWPIIARSWQIRHYDISRDIKKLRQMQDMYCQKAEEGAALDVKDRTTGEAYFKGG